MTKRMSIKKCLQIIECPAETMLNIYTVQSPEALDLLNNTGTLVCTRQILGRHSQIVVDEIGNEKIQEAYDWMAQQLRVRLGLQDERYPIWAWLKRPPLRRKERRDERGKVLIAARVPRGRMLISDFDQWHCCLNGGSVSISGEEADYLDAAEAQAQDNVVAAEMIRRTWDRIFHLRALPREEPHWRVSTRPYLQICLDEIRLDEVRYSRSL